MVQVVTRAGSQVHARLPGGVKRSGSELFRLAGSATAAFRPNPDFLLIGTKRGGTTSLYYDILKLPQVLPLFPSARLLPKANDTKGIHFFDSNYSRGENWYRSYLPSRWARSRAEKRLGGRVVVGEASPYYLFHPLAAERAAAMVPEAKLIVMLRDPVMRTHSHWKERRRNRAEPLDFADALAAEAGRLAGEEQRLRDDPAYYSYAHEQQSYVAQSRYARALEPWLDRYGRESLHIVISEEYYADPNAVLGGIADFLGINGSTIGSGEHRNAAAGSDMDPNLRRHLRATFRQDNADLERIAGRSLPWA